MSATAGKPIEAVIFDLFGTLIYNLPRDGSEVLTSRIVELLEVSADAFKTHWGRAYNDRASGKLATPAAAVEHVLELLGQRIDEVRINHAVTLRLDFLRDSFRPRETALTTLAALRERGIKLGLVSDCTTEIPLIWADTPFAPFFHATVFSCEAGMRKPAPEIYERICRQLDVAPEHCLYVGDGGSRELSGASAAGMRALWIPPAGHDARIDPEDWSGESIESLDEVLSLVEIAQAPNTTQM